MELFVYDYDYVYEIVRNVALRLEKYCSRDIGRLFEDIRGSGGQKRKGR